MNLSADANGAIGWDASQVASTAVSVNTSSVHLQPERQLDHAGLQYGQRDHRHGTNGTYSGVVLNGGAGAGAEATVVVAGGVVTSVTVTTAGNGYTLGDTLSFTIAGGSGTCKVASLNQLLNQITATLNGPSAPMQGNPTQSANGQASATTASWTFNGLTRGGLLRDRRELAAAG